MIGHTPVIVVIEPDRTKRNTLTQAQRQAGFVVISAATGPQALATLESRAVDLVLAEPNLHGLSGAEVLQKVREREARERLAPVPFVLLSGELDQASRPEAPSLMFTANMSELTSAVSQALAGAQRPASMGDL